MEHPFAITLDVGTSLVNRTGSWRTVRPDYVHRLPPCNHACPAGEDIQGWLAHAEGGDYEAAWRKLVENNPLPAVMGRVCYHPCEGACNRAGLDSAVGINSVERFLGDLAIQHGWAFEKPSVAGSGKKVLVVGAGPAGLSAAYHLARLGHQVTIKEAGPLPGGMMRFGIPKYRLPRDVLDAEVKRIADLGVRIDYNEKVGNIEKAMKAGFFDAPSSRSARISPSAPIFPAGEAAKVLDAVQVLRSMEGEDKPLLGRRVVVYGGGNTAIDVARTARRLGAEEAVIVYRRTRDKMPAHDFEVEEALEEGVMMKWLSTIKNVEAGEITVEKMALDDKGFPQPTGEYETLEADSVVLALGQDVDLSLLEGVPGLEVKDRVVQVGPNMMTGVPGIFAGGDMAPSERTVTVAVGHGKKAARHIDAWLRGGLRPAAEARGGHGRQAEHLVLRRGAEDAAPGARNRPTHLDLRGGGEGARRVERALRGAALPVLRQLLRMRQLLRRLPRQRGHQTGAGQGLPVQLRFLQGLRRLRQRMPLRRHRHDARGDLTPFTRGRAAGATRRPRPARPPARDRCRRHGRAAWRGRWRAQGLCRRSRAGW
jgi:NADPH-dependent glutamate synthase beta subunit-like oxidoreductase